MNGKVLEGEEGEEQKGFQIASPNRPHIDVTVGCVLTLEEVVPIPRE
jgi:hypothetical protein